MESNYSLRIKSFRLPFVSLHNQSRVALIEEQALH
jgi:hypothetical protein